MCYFFNLLFRLYGEFISFARAKETKPKKTRPRQFALRVPEHYFLAGI